MNTSTFCASNKLITNAYYLERVVFIYLGLCIFTKRETRNDLINFPHFLLINENYYKFMCTQIRAIITFVKKQT